MLARMQGGITYPILSSPSSWLDTWSPMSLKSGTLTPDLDYTNISIISNTDVLDGTYTLYFMAVLDLVGTPNPQVTGDFLVTFTPSMESLNQNLTVVYTGLEGVAYFSHTIVEGLNTISLTAFLGGTSFGDIGILFVNLGITPISLSNIKVTLLN